MKLLIIGGGFGGLRLARKLSNKPGFEITLIDRFNYHQFQPLFYQVATSGLDASNISFPLRKVFQKSTNILFRMATVQQISTAEKKVITDNKMVKTYDFYHPDNIFIIDDNYAQIEEFIKIPYQEISEDIVKSYSFSTWIRKITM